MNLKESELILNPDGSVYHLHLRPEQVAPLILTVGDPDRVEKVSRCFDAVEHRVQKREFVTHTGRVGRTPISVISSGIGPDNIDIVMNELDALFNIDLETRRVREQTVSLRIIRIGTAGSLQAEAGTDSFVASSAAFGFDGLMHFYGREAAATEPVLQALFEHCRDKWDFPLRPYYERANDGLLQLFSEGFIHGITATNPGFYGPQGRELRAPVRKNDYLDMLQSFGFEGRKIVNLEMETAAIYGFSRLLGHQAVSLSAILANRASGTFSQNPDKAVQKLIETVLEKLE